MNKILIFILLILMLNVVFSAKTTCLSFSGGGYRASTGTLLVFKELIRELEIGRGQTELNIHKASFISGASWAINHIDELSFNQFVKNTNLKPGDRDVFDTFKTFKSSGLMDLITIKTPGVIHNALMVDDTTITREHNDWKKMLMESFKLNDEKVKFSLPFDVSLEFVDVSKPVDLLKNMCYMNYPQIGDSNFNCLDYSYPSISKPEYYIYNQLLDIPIQFKTNDKTAGPKIVNIFKKSFKINKKTIDKTLKPLTLLDFVAFCSSAGQANIKSQLSIAPSMQLIRTPEVTNVDTTQSYSLSDAGALFSNPIRSLLEDNNCRNIISFDYTGSLDQNPMKELNKMFSWINMKYPNEKISWEGYIGLSTNLEQQPATKITISDKNGSILRTIYHCPMWLAPNGLKITSDISTFDFNVGRLWESHVVPYKFMIRKIIKKLHDDNILNNS